MSWTQWITLIISEFSESNPLLVIILLIAMFFSSIAFVVSRNTKSRCEYKKARLNTLFNVLLLLIKKDSKEIFVPVDVVGLHCTNEQEDKDAQYAQLPVKILPLKNKQNQQTNPDGSMQA